MAGLEDRITTLLSRNGATTSAALQRELGVGQATVSRAITALGDHIVRIGSGRSTRYALRRELPGIGYSWPLFRIGADGAPVLLGRLHALSRDQYWFDAPLGSFQRLSDGLPFYLQDLIPQGFIGRTVPRRYPELTLPDRITDWNDDHVLAYLCQRGEDCIGNLLLGDESLQRYLRHFRTERLSIDASDRQREYAALSDAAIAGVIAGSSAGGEHPKFTTSLMQDGSLRHVLVKFSAGGTDQVAQRWADLLVCEHLASHALHRAHLTPIASNLLTSGGRTFLEVERFDRTGARGRFGLITLAALANEYLGRRDSWMSATADLARRGIVAGEDVETVRRVATFGQLIGNTDMHFGNLSFQLSFDAPLKLAPVYDMLPMTHAPLAAGVLSHREFEPPSPTGDNLDVWSEMAALAEAYWREVAAHSAISPDFAARAQRNADRVAAVAVLR
jgi:hypothetical protein